MIPPLRKTQLKTIQERARERLDLKKAEVDLKMKALRAQAETAAKEAKTTA